MQTIITALGLICSAQVLCVSIVLKLINTMEDPAICQPKT